MTIDQLLDCLHTVPAPDNIEEWLRSNAFLSTPHGAIEASYQQAIYDLLTALGVLSAQTGEATSPMAYYFVQSLACTIRDNTFSADSWQGVPEDDCRGAGARLVRLLEETRLTCTPEPTPLRIVRASTAVIKAQRGGQDVYLMQYDAKARQFQPLGGKQELTDASSEAALTRELCEELALDGLIAGRDFAIHPLALNVRVDEISASIQVVTRYYHSLYHLTDIRFPLHNDEITRWLTGAEMTAGRTIDGYAISSLFEDYIPGMLPSLDYSLKTSLP
ncbi:MAG: hypothetical protein ABI947_12015 [Chloroflexota bacterium]